MRLITKMAKPGTGAVYNAINQLDSECEVSFSFYLPQCEKIDLMTISFDTVSIDPKYIEYIKNNPNKKIGIILDVERCYDLQNLVIEQVADLNHKDVTIICIQKEL